MASRRRYGCEPLHIGLEPTKQKKRSGIVSQTALCIACGYHARSHVRRSPRRHFSGSIQAPACAPRLLVLASS